MKNDNLENKYYNTILTNESPFYMREAYKALRVNLGFATSNVKGCKVLAITSSCPNEGKTTNCINIAISLAQTNARVLVLDSDMRKSRMHKHIGLKNTEGLSNILGGFTKLDEVVKRTAYGFDCLTAGPTPPNPSELLASGVMEELIEVLSKHYDYIIIDTPPITVVSDALVLSNVISGIILTVREGVSNRYNIDKAIESIKFSNMKIFGILYNGASHEGRSGYYGKNSRRYFYYNYDND